MYNFLTYYISLKKQRSELHSKIGVKAPNVGMTVTPLQLLIMKWCSLWTDHCIFWWKSL